MAIIIRIWYSHRRPSSKISTIASGNYFSIFILLQVIFQLTLIFQDYAFPRSFTNRYAFHHRSVVPRENLLRDTELVQIMLEGLGGGRRTWFLGDLGRLQTFQKKRILWKSTCNLGSRKVPKMKDNCVIKENFKNEIFSQIMLSNGKFLQFVLFIFLLDLLWFLPPITPKSFW